MCSLIQITDLHIAPSAGPTFHEVETRASLEKVLRDAEARNCDAIVVTGDLAMDKPDIAVYRYLKERFGATGKPYHVLPGNHDDPRMMAEVFGTGLNAGTLNRVVEAGGVPMIFLDTAESEVRERDLEFLESALDRLAGRSPLVFLHHPLIPCAHPFMDHECYLLGREKLLQLLESRDAVRHVFCGHAHKNYSATRAGITHYVTPSTAAEFYSCGGEVFVGHRLPGFRKITVDPATGAVAGRAIYLD